jgi:thiol:disulfide interchange protein DsbA
MHFRALVAAVSFLILPLTACGAGGNYAEGTDYRTINPPVAVDVPRGKVQVMELFWYGCPHCYHMDPELSAWVKRQPSWVEFVRVPAVFKRYNPDGSPNPWYLHAKAFYALQALGVGDKLHGAFFKAIHEQGRTLRDEDELAKFFAENGVAEKDFRPAFNSFMVDTKVRQAMDLSAQSGINGVPALVINGKYQALGDSFDVTFKVADFLIAKEHGAR